MIPWYSFIPNLGHYNYTKSLLNTIGQSYYIKDYDFNFNITIL